jgi:hypothetical protein
MLTSLFGYSLYEQKKNTSFWYLKLAITYKINTKLLMF